MKRAAIAVLLLLVAGTGVWVWDRVASRGLVAEVLCERPSLAGWPAELEARVEELEGRAAASGRRGAALALGDLSDLYFANGFWAEALHLNEGLDRAGWGDVRRSHRRAVILAGYGRLDEALALWERVEQEKPDYLPARIKRADALYKANRTAEAEALYRAVLEREPGQPYALLGLARLEVDQGRLKEALARLVHAARVSAGTVGEDLLATVHEKLGNEAEAAALRSGAKSRGAFNDIADPWVDDLFESHGYDAYRLSLAGGFFERRGDPRTGLRLLARAVEFSKPESRTLRRMELAQMHLRSGSTREAVGLLRLCTAESPTLSEPWVLLADLQFRSGDSQGGFATVSQGLAHCPESPALHLARGEHLLKTGRIPEAEAAFRKSISLRPEEADAYLRLALALSESGRLPEGLRVLEEAQRVEPGHPAVLTTGAMVAVELGRRDEARSWIRLARNQPRVAREDLGTVERTFRVRFAQDP